MPKMKTHKGAQSRFRITGSGKIVQAKIGKSHLRCKKPSRVKRLYGSMHEVDPANTPRVKRLLPYR